MLLDQSIGGDMKVVELGVKHFRYLFPGATFGVAIGRWCVQQRYLGLIGQCAQRAGHNPEYLAAIQARPTKSSSPRGKPTHRFSPPCQFD